MQNFTEGNISKQIIAFSVPMLIGSLFQQMYSLVDAVVVGRFVGGSALAAVGVSMNAVFFLTAVIIGLTTGASVVISQLYGAKQIDKLERAVSTSILFLGALSLLITVLGVLLTPWLLRVLNAPYEVFEDARIYLQIMIGGAIFPTFYNMYTAYLRALGDSRSPLYILIFANVLSIILSLLFVITFGWGVAGAAIATVIAQAVSAVLCCLYTRRYVRMLWVKKFSFDYELFCSILKYGAPAAVQLSLVMLAHLTIMRLINSFGTVAAAGIAAANKIDHLAMVPITTLSMALSTFVAQNMGANLESRAIQGFYVAMRYTLLLTVVITAVLILSASWLISLFLDPNYADTAEILLVGRNYLSILVFFYFLLAILFCFNGFFRGAGDAMIAMVFPVVSLTIRAISAYALVDLGGMGTEALAWSIPIGWGTMSIASWIYFKKRLWVGKSIIKKV